MILEIIVGLTVLNSSGLIWLLERARHPAEGRVSAIPASAAPISPAPPISPVASPPPNYSPINAEPVRPYWDRNKRVVVR